MALARSGSMVNGVFVRSRPGSASLMIAIGSSLRGLSEVRIDEIAAAPGGFAHQRTLGTIAIAAAAEDGDHLAAAARNEFAGERGEVAQRVVGVGVVHDHGEGLAGVHALEAAGHAGEALDTAGNGFRRAVARERRGGRRPACCTR